jgi:hypothetical protein
VVNLPKYKNSKMMKTFSLNFLTVVILLFACNNEKSKDKDTRSDSSSLTGPKAQSQLLHDSVTSKFPAPGKFHHMLARSNGSWTGKATIWPSANAQPVPAGNSFLVNSMAVDGLYQVSEIKGIPAAGKPWTGIRITGYDSERNLFTRAMIGDGISANGVVMEGVWSDSSRSIIMPFKQRNHSTGQEHSFKEVYKIVDENTEVLEIHRTDDKTGKEYLGLRVIWTRNGSN